jgi:hypothetical protein
MSFMTERAVLTVATASTARSGPENQQSTSSGRWLRSCDRAEVNSATGAEHGGAVAVLERQPDAVVPLDRGAHRVAGHQPQQLAAGRLIGRWHLVVGELAARAQVRDQAGDHVPGVRQRGPDALEERGVVHLTVACLPEQLRRNR